MTRARMPRPHEVAAARRDPRLLRAFSERGSDETWRTRGVCRSVDPETFFPAPSEPADTAVALCRTCPVQGSCLAWALDVGDCHGVWGGTTPRERRAMLVAWRGQPMTEPEPACPGLTPATGPARVGLAPVAAAGPLVSGLVPVQRAAPDEEEQPVLSRPAFTLGGVSPTPLPRAVPAGVVEDEDVYAWEHLVAPAPA